MRSIRLPLTILGRTPVDVFDVVADLRRYPELSPAVRHVEVAWTAPDTTISQWEVNFRRGILRWEEEDRYHRAEGRIEFRQTEGDMAVFEGIWAVEADELGAALTFTATFDLGIPTLADALEPIAERTLVDNTIAIVEGLFGADVVVVDLDGLTGSSVLAGAAR
jgi:ribosome-associated toxin RatA of RatAB toxin-antitoxin module